MDGALLDEVAVDNREFGRFSLSEPCLLIRNKRKVEVRTRNISKGGLCVVSHRLGRTCLGADFLLVLRDFDPINATMRWQSEQTYGLAFLDPVEDHPQLWHLIESLRDLTGVFGN